MTSYSLFLGLKYKQAARKRGRVLLRHLRAHTFHYEKLDGRGGQEEPEKSVKQLEFLRKHRLTFCPHTQTRKFWFVRAFKQKDHAHTHTLRLLSLDTETNFTKITTKVRVLVQSEA